MIHVEFTLFARVRKVQSCLVLLAVLLGLVWILFYYSYFLSDSLSENEAKEHKTPTFPT